MSSADREQHWQKVWTDKRESETSWHQAYPGPSLAMIEDAALGPGGPIIDIGGGASLLVDHVLAAGFVDVSVLDISAAAIDRARQRLGRRAEAVRWIVSDVVRFEPDRPYALWHDRAAFHFLLEAELRRQYVRVLERAVQAGGQVVLATFAPGGPRQCSGLETRRYGADDLQSELGPGWQLEDQVVEHHQTPLGRVQKFGFYRFRRGPNGPAHFG